MKATILGFVCLSIILSAVGLCACGDETGVSWDTGSYATDSGVDSPDGGNATEDGGVKQDASTTDATEEDAGVVETWYDETSNLTWEVRPTGGEMPFIERLDGGEERSPVLEHCKNVRAPGKWRLPTINDLRSLVRGCPDAELGGACKITDDRMSGFDSTCGGWHCPEGDGPADGCYWPKEMKGICDCYWAVIPKPRANLHEQIYGIVCFSYGGIFNFHDIDEYDSPHYLRCVKTGK